jgi:hypothetical protein
MLSLASRISIITDRDALNDEGAQLSANGEAQGFSFQIATAVVLLPPPLRHGSSNRAGVTIADRY